MRFEVSLNVRNYGAIGVFWPHSVVVNVPDDSADPEREAAHAAIGLCCRNFLETCGTFRIHLLQ